MRERVLELLNKSPGYGGFHTNAKVDAAINDSLDYVASHAFEAGEGWFKEIEEIDMPATGFTANLPTGCVFVDQVRYLHNDTYIPLQYDSGDGEYNQNSDSSVTEFPGAYRLFKNTLYFNPAPTERGTDMIQIEYTKFPDELSAVSDTTNAQFDRAMLNYVKWRAASQLMTLVGRPQPDWVRYEDEWFLRVKEHLWKRVKHTTYVEYFDG